MSAEPLVLETAYQFTTSSDATVGIPQNNGAFWDGSRYWLFYSDNNTLKARHGTSLANMQASDTRPDGPGNVTGLVNNKTFSTVFGQSPQGQWQAWVLANRTPTGSSAGSATEEFSVYRYDLTTNGLASPTSLTCNLSPKPAPTHVTLSANYDSFIVTDLYGAIHSGRGNSNETATRRIAPGLKSDTGLSGPVMSDTRFAEATWIFQANNGLVLSSINVGDFGNPLQRGGGDFGNFSEWTRTGISDPNAWGTEATLEAPGPGNWRDMDYAADTSHAGQTDFAQLADGTVFNAYVSNADPTNGNFGRLTLKQRGLDTGDSWTTAALDAVGQDVWHVSLTSDGDDLYLLYVKDDQGQRDDAIFLRGFDPDTGTFTDETAIATIAPGSRFERMTTQWRFTDHRLTLFWSQTADDGATLDTYLTAVTIPEPASLSLLAVGAAAALRRRDRRD